MRDIRFRAWDIEKKEFYHEPIGIYNHLPVNWQKFYDLMQYTGLKDANGKEIYESDRVETPNGIGIVKWDRCFRLFWNDKDSTTLHDCQEEHLEVIRTI